YVVDFCFDPPPFYVYALSLHDALPILFIDRALLDAQRQSGKKFTDAEIVQHIDRLFANSTELKRFWSNRSVATLAMKPSDVPSEDRKSTRLNSSHVKISYAVFCLKIKK